MSPAAAVDPAALAPVRDGLLRRARADAEQTLAAARADADRVLAAARADADAVRAQAVARGEADGAASRASTLAAAGRSARRTVLAGQRQAYDDLVADVRHAASAWAATPAARTVLQATARQVLGPEATITPDGNGGLIAQQAGRRVDCSLDALTADALRRLGSAAGELWAP